MSHRAFNFGAGPAAMPLSVVEQIREDLPDFQGTGVSILETSHRSPTYDAVHEQCIASLRDLIGGAPNHEILFMSGGARTQFSLIPMNLLADSGTADYINTGHWSRLAVADGAKLANVRTLWSSEETGNDRVPQEGVIESLLSSNLEARSAPGYLHTTSNNTIAGTQYHHVPDSGSIPLVCDMSSDILSRPFDVDRFGLVYAGAQKNLGPAGVTIVIVRKDLLERSAESLPVTMSYAAMAAKRSLLNTPPVFSIYAVGLVAKWLIERGGLAAVEDENEAKAAHLYGAIDASDGFYRGHAQVECRSRMNVAFRIHDQALEPKFIAEAADNDMIGLKGHRSVGGIRASTYNATRLPAVEALVEFMADFRRRHG